MSGLLEFRPYIEESAKQFNLSPQLISAVILQESGGFKAAFRYERKFYWKYIAGRTKQRLGGHWPTDRSEDEERTLRSCSFGLMQVMGQVAREFGFKGGNLFDLYDPKTNIYFGSLKLSREIEKARDKGSPNPIHDGLLGFNGGGNPRYPDEVIKKLGVKLH